MISINASHGLLAIYSLVVILSILAPQLSAHAIVKRADNPELETEPLTSFTVLLTHVPQGQDYGESFALPTTFRDKQTPLHLDTGNDMSWALSNLLPSGQYPKPDIWDVSDAVRCPAPAIGHDDGTEIDGDFVDVAFKTGELQLTASIVAARSIEPVDQLCAKTSIEGNIGFNFRDSSLVKVAYMKGLIKAIFKIDLRISGPPKVTLSLDLEEVADTTTWFPRYEVPSDDPNDDQDQWSFLPSPETPYMIDSGTSELYLPPDIVKNYYQKAKFRKLAHSPNGYETQYFVGCDEIMPDFSFSLGKLNVKIPGIDLKGKKHDTDPAFCLGRLVGYDNSPNDDDPDKNLFYVLGVPFMKQYPIYFDMADSGEIGIEMP